MEAAREGHEDVVQLLVEHGAVVNAQTEETQETALTLACCGGFLEVVQYLIDHGADIELGASTPLMEAAQEGNVDIVQFLIKKGVSIHAETSTGDTALTYACANGHTVIADILLQCGAELEHESEGGRTPLMKAARAGHLQTVQFLVSKGADVNRHTSSNDHSVLSLSCAGGHVNVVQYLLMQGAEPTHTLRDNSSMLIEASRGGHTTVANLLLRQPKTSLSSHKPIGDADQAGRRVAVGRKILPPTSNHAHRLPPGSHGATDATGGGLGPAAHQQGQGSIDRPAALNGSETAPGSLSQQQGAEGRDSKKLVMEEGGDGGGVAQELGAKRQKMDEGGGDKEQPASQQDVPPRPFLPASDPSLQYAADPSTALKNIRRMTASAEAAYLQPSVAAAPPTISTPTGPSMSPQFGGVNPDDIIQGHVTAEDIINRYWMQRAHQSSSGEGAEGPTNPEALFSAGNFGQDLPQPPTEALLQQPPGQRFVVPKFHAGAGSGAGLPAEGGGATIPTSAVAAVAAAAAGSFLSSADISRLLPQLEAIAGSLSPTSLESQYLAALAHSHMLPSALASLAAANPQALPSPECSGVEGQPQIPGFEALPSAEMAKLLPSLAHLDGQEGAELPPDLQTQPIYSTEFQAMRQLSQKMHSSTSEGQDLDVEESLHNRPRSLSASFLLDGNFPLDIPPPSDLIPDHLPAMLPSGYMGSSLENDSYPSSEEDDEVDEEEESDSSFLTHDLNSLPPGSYETAIDIDQQTDSNHDTALTMAAAGGHDELVELLLAHGANCEHRDKKGCTPLILAASAGHAMTVAILLDHNADIEAQSDRTKDTALSLACSGGRQEVVELLLAKGANFEHRNVSDYTPLSLAASGGYVGIIKLLLRAGADINSRTGSKLGITPLMLAAMNGHTTAVKLLLDMGSDINAQIETNRNTALTLACFQGRHEVVSLLVERQANVEHRAKTGLTPLMEAASGGYHEVGRVLIAKGADVNAAPVPSSRDTALTIAADKGHFKFVDLILRQGAHVDVKNKKGNSPLWLACNGGHLDVVRLLVDHSADVDSQDNRKVSCLMAAFRKGHFKAVKFLVGYVSQFPSDSELTRYISTLSDKELLKKCHRCVEVIIDAKERQAAEANKNANILLQEIELEMKHEEDRKAAAARKRAKKKRQKEKKQQQKTQKPADKGGEGVPGDMSPDDPAEPDGEEEGGQVGNEVGGEEVESPEATPIPLPEILERKPEPRPEQVASGTREASRGKEEGGGGRGRGRERGRVREGKGSTEGGRNRSTKMANHVSSSAVATPTSGTTNLVSPLGMVAMATVTTPTSSPRKGRKEDGWKEVGRRTKKLSIPVSVFPLVVGKASANLVAIRHATNTHIEIDKHSKQSPHRSITVRGSIEAIKQAQHYITLLIRDPSRDITQLLPKPSHTTHTNVGGAKGHVRSHDPSSVSSTDFSDEPSVSLPVKSSGAAIPAGVMVTASSGNSLPTKSVHRKTGGVVGTSAAVSAGTRVSSAAGTTVGSKGVRTASAAVDRKPRPPPSSEHKAVATHTTIPAVTTTTSRLQPSATAPAAVHHPTILARTSSAPAMPAKGSSAGSGAVRRLFASSSHGATTTSTTVVVSATQTLPCPPKGAVTMLVSSLSQRPIASGVIGVGVSASGMSSAQQGKPVTSVVSLQHAPGPTGNRHLQSQHGSRAPAAETSSSKVVGEPSKPSTAYLKGVVPHHGVIGGGGVVPSTTTGPQATNVIEQPLQQIMNTPTILQEPATQIARPKRKSTYSDAVGKKLPSSSVPAESKAGHSGGVGAPPTSTHIPPQQAPLSLAPGAWPLASEIEMASYHAPPKPSPWSDSTDTSTDFRRQSFEEDNALSHPAANLGPIGPPSRTIRQPQTIMGGAHGGGTPTPGSFSPGGSQLPKTSPTGASPQRNELSPAAKSPLLGAAPPGLLPPPDKAMYGASFRPIQFQPSDFPPPAPTSEGSGSFQTLIPTPMRNPRPPLLATPPGFGHPLMQQGLHQSPLLSKQGQPASPTPSPDRGSPNKSPPQPQVGKGFNPNAPTFIPRGLPNVQRPSNPPTSSILGAPPPVKFPGFIPPAGSSILGSAPQLPTSIISAPTLIGNQQPQPPSVQGNQSSILGQPPPMPPLNPQIFAAPPPTPGQQAFLSLPLSRQSQSLYAPPFEGNLPPHPAPHQPSQEGLIHPPGFTLIHLSTPAQNLNGLPIQNFAPGSMKDAFAGVGGGGMESSFSQSVSTGEFSKLVPLYREKPDQLSQNSTGVDAPSHPQHMSTLPGPVLLAVSGTSGPFDPTSKHPLHHPHQVIGGRTNLFGISLGQLGPVHGDSAHSHLPDQDSSGGGDQEASLGKFPPDTFALKAPGLNQSFPPSAYSAYLHQVSEMAAVSSDMMISTVSGYALVPTGIFTAPGSAGTAPGSEEKGDEGGTDSLPPIGTERAHKRSSSLPGSAPFPVLAPGINPSNVWSYSGHPSTSEDSDWSKAATGTLDSSDWPTALTPPSSTVVSAGGGVASRGVVISPQDNLESVLERVGLVEHLPLFKSNEIDLDALVLMSEKDFSEIGLPKAACVKLLSAFGKVPHTPEGLASQQADDPAVAMATRQSSDPMTSQEPAKLVASLPSNQQSDSPQ